MIGLVKFIVWCQCSVKGAVSDFWQKLLIFEITNINTFLTKRIAHLDASAPTFTYSLCNTWNNSKRETKRKKHYIRKMFFHFSYTLWEPMFETDSGEGLDVPDFIRRGNQCLFIIAEWRKIIMQLKQTSKDDTQVYSSKGHHILLLWITKPTLLMYREEIKQTSPSFGWAVKPTSWLSVVIKKSHGTTSKE